MQPLSARSQGLKPSQTVAIDTRYKELKSQGADIISLAAGEPDFDTPEGAKNAAIDSIRGGLTKYTAVTGLPELRKALSIHLQESRGVAYSPEEIVVSGGAKTCVFNALQALCDAGDEVLVPSPYWVTYPELVRFVGGVPVILPTSPASGFKISAAQLRDALTPRSKALMLNSPSNPTGAMYTEDELGEIAEVLVENDLYCISDEIYGSLCYGDAHHTSPAAVSSDMRERTLLIDGFSKSHAMTGWRLGFLAAPLSIARTVASIQSQTTHHPANASQIAGLAALKDGGAFTRAMTREFTQRRSYVLDRLAALPGVSAFPPQGAFYVFFSVREALARKGGVSSLDFCRYLLEEKGLALVPGEGFGMEGFVRLSFAASPDNLRLGLDRLEAGLQDFL